MNKINEIIDRYIPYKYLHDVLKKYYTERELSPEEETTILNKIKKVITSYYLYTYEFREHVNNVLQYGLVKPIAQLCNLSKKIILVDGKVKVYPVAESEDAKKRFYAKVMGEMVDYQIEHNMSIEEVFSIFSEEYGAQEKKFKQILMKADMEPFYGSVYYIIERSLYIIECIRQLPDTSINLDEMESVLIQYKAKYLDGRPKYEKDGDFSDVGDEFYDDYDLIEANYKRLMALEDELLPKVVAQWKLYLTDPNNHDENYRYVMHSFSRGLTDPQLMSKACCSLFTPTIENLIYGHCGLIFDLDIDSVASMCTGDAGSWRISKELFIETGCPGGWQLPSPNGDNIYYENTRNCKLIMPDKFESDCKKKIESGDFHYSEIMLNAKARPIGVFYTEECQNLEEVREYAKKHNLPLVKIDVYKGKAK